MIPETPITGVISQNSVPLIWDDMNDFVNLDYEEFLKTSPTDDEKDMYCDDDATYLTGYKLDESTGLYDIDETAEYSAIISCPVIQITHSKHTARANKCSPCYPNQADLDTPGDLLAYCLPVELFDTYAPCPYEVVN